MRAGAGSREQAQKRKGRKKKKEKKTTPTAGGFFSASHLNFGCFVQKTIATPHNVQGKQVQSAVNGGV
jgi:hypothetical protein